MGVIRIRTADTSSGPRQCVVEEPFSSDSDWIALSRRERRPAFHVRQGGRLVSISGGPVLADAPGFEVSERIREAIPCGTLQVVAGFPDCIPAARDKMQAASSRLTPRTSAAIHQSVRNRVRKTAERSVPLAFDAAGPSCCHASSSASVRRRVEKAHLNAAT